MNMLFLGTFLCIHPSADLVMINPISALTPKQLHTYILFTEELLIIDMLGYLNHYNFVYKTERIFLIYKSIIY